MTARYRWEYYWNGQIKQPMFCLTLSVPTTYAPLLTTAIRNPVSLQHQWVFQRFNEVRPHCAVLEHLLFSMCTVLYTLNSSDILLSSTDCGKNELTDFLNGNEPFTCIQCTYITICSSLTPPPPPFNVGLDSGNGSLPTLNRGGGI